MDVKDLQGAGLFIPYDKLKPHTINEVKYRIIDTILALIGGALWVPKDEIESLYSLIDENPNVMGFIPGKTDKLLVFVSTLDDLAPVAEHQKAAGKPPYIEGDKVSFLSYNNKSSELSMKISTIDLKNKKFIAENENYILKLRNEKFDHNIQQIRDIDNKLYITVDAYEDWQKVKPRKPLNKEYIYVIDKTTNKTLYTGIVKDESTSYIHTSIVTNDEL